MFRAFAILFICVAISLGLVAAGSQYTLIIASYPSLLLIFAFAFMVQWLVFIPSFIFKTERYYDLAGSTTFIVCAIVVGFFAKPLNSYQLICITMVVIWAARLGAFLFLRIHQDGKDTRFDSIKHDPFRFFVTWTIQGLWVVLTAGALYSAVLSNATFNLGMDLMSWLVYVGLTLWVLGLSIELAADHQKRVFKSKLANKDKFITTGLWAYARHPNYFGEILLWFGAALVASVALSGWQHISLISPVFVYLLLTRVSGIPMLEAKSNKRWGDDLQYQEYVRQTNALIPWPFGKS